MKYDQAKHTEFDELHGELLTLLDKIEAYADSSLASERFIIMESRGYSVVIEVMKEDD